MKQTYIGITIGDPSGIGPEVALKALSTWTAPEDIHPVLIGSQSVIQSTCTRLKTPLKLITLSPDSLSEGQHHAKMIPMIDIPSNVEIVPGAPSSDTGALALQYIDKGIELAQANTIQAVVTGPVSKEYITESGVHFTGHTEYFAHRTGTRRVVMMFQDKSLYVSLATTHHALRKVPFILNTERVLDTITISAQALSEQFGILSPRIAVCGLNPHAGEGGLLGKEDHTIIRPAIDTASRKSIQCSGPYPADTIFRRHLNGEFDCVIAMYHDQALCAVKTIAPHAVNVTLGLPFIRTSVDHGTAFDIAGSDKANPESFINALNTAIHMCSANQLLF